MIEFENLMHFLYKYLNQIRKRLEGEKLMEELPTQAH